MMGPWFGHFGGFGLGGIPWMLLLGVLIIGILISMVINKKNTNNNDVQRSLLSSKEPIEIAKSRLANGEISIEEFEQIKKHL